MQETREEMAKRHLKEINEEYRKDVLAITLAVVITIIYLWIAPYVIGFWALPGLILLVEMVCKFVIEPIIK